MYTVSEIYRFSKSFTHIQYHCKWCNLIGYLLLTIYLSIFVISKVRLWLSIKTKEITVYNNVCCYKLLLLLLLSLLLLYRSCHVVAVAVIVVVVAVVAVAVVLAVIVTIIIVIVIHCYCWNA